MSRFSQPYLSQYTHWTKDTRWCTSFERQAKWLESTAWMRDPRMADHYLCVMADCVFNDLRERIARERGICIHVGDRTKVEPWPTGGKFSRELLDDFKVFADLMREKFAEVRAAMDAWRTSPGLGSSQPKPKTSANGEVARKTE